MPNWMQAYSGTGTGLVLIPTAFTPSMFSIVSVARSLSMQCRFGGHVRAFYSVAEHTVRGSYIPQTRRHQQHFFVHDHTEHAVIDLPRPIKEEPEAQWYRDVEADVDITIHDCLGLLPSTEDAAITRHIDNTMLATEARDLLEDPPMEWSPMPPPLVTKIRPMSPAIAEVAFLARFVELFNDHRPAATHVMQAKARLRVLWWPHLRYRVRCLVANLLRGERL